jgi:hypothetical protein
MPLSKRIEPHKYYSFHAMQMFEVYTLMHGRNASFCSDGAAFASGMMTVYVQQRITATAAMTATATAPAAPSSASLGGGGSSSIDSSVVGAGRRRLAQLSEADYAAAGLDANSLADLGSIFADIGASIANTNSLLASQLNEVSWVDTAMRLSKNTCTPFQCVRLAVCSG